MPQSSPVHKRHGVRAVLTPLFDDKSLFILATEHAIAREQSTASQVPAFAAAWENSPCQNEVECMRLGAVPVRTLPAAAGMLLPCGGRYHAAHQFSFGKAPPDFHAGIPRAACTNQLQHAAPRMQQVLSKNLRCSDAALQGPCVSAQACRRAVLCCTADVLCCTAEPGKAACQQKAGPRPRSVTRHPGMRHAACTRRNAHATWRYCSQRRCRTPAATRPAQRPPPLHCPVGWLLGLKTSARPWCPAMIFHRRSCARLQAGAPARKADCRMQDLPGRFLEYFACRCGAASRALSSSFG